MIFDRDYSKHFIASIVSLMILSVVVAFNAAAADLQAAPISAAKAAPDPALWKLTDEDSEIYLFGTIHILNPNLNWKSAKVEAAFDASETVIFEAPADTSNPEATQAMVAKYGLNPSGTTLSSLLTFASNQRLAAVLEQLGLKGAAANFEPLRPWLAGASLSVLQIQSVGGDPNAGVERILSAQAARDGKAVGYFETDEQQIQILSGLSPEAEVYFLEEGLRQIQEEPDQILELVEAWRSGDQVAMNDMLVAGFAGQDEVMESFLTRRNFNWASQIEQLMQGSGTVFVAVGAAHLVGKQSVQVYLSEKGFNTVRQ